MFLPVSDKVAPSLEKRIAVAAPMPLEAPVIKATLPENFDPTCEAIAEKWKIQEWNSNHWEQGRQNVQISVQIGLIFVAKLKACPHHCLHLTHLNPQTLCVFSILQDYDHPVEETIIICFM